MKITFKRTEIEKLVADVIANPPGKVPYTGGEWERVLGKKGKERFERGLQLVGDRGVYLMGNQPLAESSLPFVSYAKEINPLTSPDWYQSKRLAFGGDDGIIFLPVDMIVAWLSRNQNKDSLTASLTPKRVSLV